MLQSKSTSFGGLVIVLSLVMALFGYWIDRSHFPGVIGLFLAGFLSYFLICFKSESFWTSGNRFWIAALLPRVVLLFSAPELSDDFYRFFWDGWLSTNGVHPFDMTPIEYMRQATTFPEGFSELNSPNYYSVYPSVCQRLFQFAAWVAGGRLEYFVIVLRLVFIIFEIGTIRVALSLLKKLKLPGHLIFWYVFNPLVIVEFTGNLHFEGVAVFFTILSLRLAFEKYTLLSAVMLGLAISTKLLPLILAPAFVLILGWKRAWVFGFHVIWFTCLLFVAYFSSEQFGHLLESVNLYFESFEFNSSFYRLGRWLYENYWNQGLVLVKVLGLISLAAVYWLGIFRKNKPTVFDLMIWVQLVYYLFAQSIHPWYIASVLIFIPFTQTRIPVVWSVLVVLSYKTYETSMYTQDVTLIWAQYLVLVAWATVEIVKRKKGDLDSLKLT